MKALSALLLSIALGTIGCADGTLQFDGAGTITSENDTVVVSGDIDDSQLADGSGGIGAVPAERDVAVFVYSDLRCCNAAFTPSTDLPFGSVDFGSPPFDTVELSDLRFSDVESVIVDGGAGPFTVNDVSKGDLTVLFLLDDAVTDGSIEPGDPVAVLSDDDNRLESVAAGRSVTISAIDITFDRSFPDGKADPNTIKIGQSNGSSP